MTQTDFEPKELQQNSFKHKLIEQLNDNKHTTIVSHGVNQIPPPPPIPMFHPSKPTKSISHGFLGFSPVSSKVTTKEALRNEVKTAKACLKSTDNSKTIKNRDQRIIVTPDQLETRRLSLRKVIFRKNSVKRSIEGKENQSLKSVENPNSCSDKPDTVAKFIRDSDSFKNLMKQRRQLISPPQTPGTPKVAEKSSEWGIFVETPKRKNPLVAKKPKNPFKLNKIVTKMK